VKGHVLGNQGDHLILGLSADLLDWAEDFLRVHLGSTGLLKDLIRLLGKALKKTGIYVFKGV
jgi:hypothetical protein